VKSNKYYIIIIAFFVGIIVVVLFITQSKKDEYLVRGKKSYEKHCANCHGANGEGLQLLIPPLTDPVWINNDTIVCIIKNGMDGEIVVNGNSYNNRMTSNATIENDEIADLISYMRNSFIGTPNRLSLKEVTEKSINCR
jgi:mono/diheme cytochrome c family protein